jgi:magnesium chelatase family protein
MTAKQLKRICPISDSCRQLLIQALERFHLSARSYYRLLKVARTIADVELHDDIQVSDIAEALSYRPTELT